ncbi:hypothetical protein ACFC00_14090 [Streptomyces adustus]|uniref:hypothetical protein n=1 Tax=Streptomyces adustus TaxID=1609272 RepID=UPI0035DACCCA
MPELVATLTAPLPAAEADAPQLVHLGGCPALLQRGDGELVVQLLDEAFGVTRTLRFRAPWPRRSGSHAVAPDADLAVFTGRDAVRAVDAEGSVRWEVRHGGWPHPDRGSAAFSPDGRLVWAHVRGPLLDAGEPDPDAVDEWLVLDAVDGRVLARADAQAAAAGSVHVPHPDPARMGLSIGEGQDGAPLRWGHFDGERLAVAYFEGQDLVLLDVNPSGSRFLTVDHDQNTLAVHETASGAVVARWDAGTSAPRHPDAEPDNDEAEPYWDWAGGFVDDTTVLASTVESDEEWGEGRHWLVGATPQGPAEPEPVGYPLPVTSPPAPLGAGRWYTYGTAYDTLHVWAARA